MKMSQQYFAKWRSEAVYNITSFLLVLISFYFEGLGLPLNLDEFTV